MSATKLLETSPGDCWLVHGDTENYRSFTTAITPYLSGHTRDFWAARFNDSIPLYVAALNSNYGEPAEGVLPVIVMAGYPAMSLTCGVEPITRESTQLIGDLVHMLRAAENYYPAPAKKNFTRDVESRLHAYLGMQPHTPSESRKSEVDALLDSFVWEVQG